jgi:hypothetical protein
MRRIVLAMDAVAVVTATGSINAASPELAAIAS